MATISSRTELTSIDDQDDVIVLDDVSASVTKKMKIGTVLKKVQDGSIVYAADSVGTDAYAVTLSPVPAAYVNGMVINFKAGTANTGAATLNANGLGAVTIKKNNDQDLSTNDIEANQIVSVVYNSTGPKFQMQSQLANAGITTDGTETITGAKAFTGDSTHAGDETFSGATLFTGNTIAKLLAPQGFLINGKISPTVSNSDLILAIKTLSGGDPSATDPVYVRIGDTIRSITSALAVTAADGTNWFAAGSTELATKEIDYFAYLGYNATDGVVLGFSRYPGASQYSDFSTTQTNEKFCRISTITTAAATDYYEVVGRFAATLSAGAGYTWTVPTYTAINLIQRPIYETRKLSWAATYTCSGSMTFGTLTVNSTEYKVRVNEVEYYVNATGTTGGVASNTIFVTTPWTAEDALFSGTGFKQDATNVAAWSFMNSTTQIGIREYSSANWALGVGRGAAAYIKVLI